MPGGGGVLNENKKCKYLSYAGTELTTISKSASCYVTSAPMRWRINIINNFFMLCILVGFEHDIYEMLKI